MKLVVRITFLLFLLLAVAIPPVAAEGPIVDPQAAAVDVMGSVSGRVFNDANGNGLFDAAPELEGGLVLEGVLVTIEATNGSGFLATLPIVEPAGTYCFPDLAPGTYRVSVNVPPAYLATLPTSQDVELAADQGVEGVDFAMSWPRNVQGVVYQEIDAPGHTMGTRDLDEPRVPGVEAGMFEDVDGNGVIDLGDDLLGSALTDDSGNYVIANVVPGVHLIRFVLPGGTATDPLRLELVSGEVMGAYQMDQGFALGSVTGVVWNDTDGDGVVEPGEANLPGVRVLLTTDLNANGSADAGETTVERVTTGDGFFAFAGIGRADYLLTVDPQTVAAGWVLGNNGSSAFKLSFGETKAIDIGAYDPFNVAPLSALDWKRECRGGERTRYTEAELAALILKAEENSSVFPEMSGICDSLLQSIEGNLLGEALMQDAAQQLNLASARLLPKTPLNPGSLTTVATVAEAAMEVENLIQPPAGNDPQNLQRAIAIADSLNSGRGIGSGLEGGAKVARAVYDGRDATWLLRSGGGTLDVTKDVPVYLERWSPGSISANTRIFRTQLRVKVQSSFSGGVIEVWQAAANPNASPVLLGLAASESWNRELSMLYTFDIRQVPTMGDLMSTEFVLYARDGSQLDGRIRRVKLDSAELRFRY